jgi:hypothetical protein
LEKIVLKVRRHPGVQKDDCKELYVTILPDDGSGKNPKVYLDNGEYKDVILGCAKMNNESLASSDSTGGTTFDNVEIVFRGVDKPILISGKLYWMKISTIPYGRNY